MLSLKDLVKQQIDICFRQLDSAKGDDEQLYILDQIDKYVDTIRTDITVRQEILKGDK